MANLYSLLELPIFASKAEIKKSFKKLAFKNHPDTNPGNKTAEEKFKLINRAYQILSDDYKRSRYDEMLRYQLRNPYDFERKAQHRDPAYRRNFNNHPQKKNKKKRSYNILTFLIFGLGIILFQVITEVNKKVMTEKQKSYEVKQDSMIIGAKRALEKGQLRRSITFLNNLEYGSSSEEVKNMRTMIFEYADIKAIELVDMQQYDSALYYLLFILDFRKHVGPDTYTLLSKCYRNTGQSNLAVAMFKGILTVNRDHLLAHKQLAEIYSQDLDDLDQSIFHYEEATRIIVENYIEFYGGAYMAIINPKNHPHSDFEVFLEKSKLYYTTNKIDSALVASKWAAFLAPDMSETYLVQGLCMIRKNDLGRACMLFRKAGQQKHIIPELDSLINLTCFSQ